MQTQIEPSPSENKSAPGCLGYYLAGAITLVTIGVLVVLVVSMVGHFIEMFDLQSFQAPGEIQVQLDKPGDYGIYIRTDRAQRDTLLPVVDSESPNKHLRIAAEVVASGEQIPVKAAELNSTLTINERHYKGFQRFHLAAPGLVRVTAGYDEGVDGEPVELAVGPDFNLKSFAATFGKIAAISLTVVCGFGLAATCFIVTFVRRKNALKRTAVANQAAPPAIPPPAIPPPAIPPPGPPVV